MVITGACRAGEAEVHAHTCWCTAIEHLQAASYIQELLFSSINSNAKTRSSCVSRVKEEKNVYCEKLKLETIVQSSVQNSKRRDSGWRFHVYRSNPMCWTNHNRLFSLMDWAFCVNSVRPVRSTNQQQPRIPWIILTAAGRAWGSVVTSSWCILSRRIFVLLAWYASQRDCRVLCGHAFFSPWPELTHRCAIDEREMPLVPRGANAALLRRNSSRLQRQWKQQAVKKIKRDRHYTLNPSSLLRQAVSVEGA